MREANGGVEPVEEEELRDALRARARGIYRRSTALAVLATVVAWWLPL